MVGLRLSLRLAFGWMGAFQIVSLGGRRLLQLIPWVEIQRHGGGGGGVVFCRSSATLCGGWKDVGIVSLTSSIDTVYQEKAPQTYRGIRTNNARSFGRLISRKLNKCGP